MKIVNKLLPLTALTAVATVPVVATSCSKVWTDVLASKYIPSFEPLSANETTNSDATESYFNYFKNHANEMMSDAYWGVSTFAREILGPKYGVEVQSYLTHLDSAKYNNSDGKNRIFYKFQCQIQVKENSEEDDTTYCIVTWDLSWEIHNLEFSIVHTGSTANEQLWTVCPVKFDYERGVWYENLTGDEYVKFDFKNVIKGYNASGAQSYIKETNESAIIDEEHQYAPALTNTFTASLMFESYYLSKQDQRIWIDTELKGIDRTTLSDDLTFDFGSLTIRLSGGKTVTLTVPQSQIRVVSNSGFKVKDITFEAPITVTSAKPSAKFTINKEDGSPDPSIGDKIYFTVHADCEGTWNEDFYISAMFI